MTTRIPVSARAASLLLCTLVMACGGPQVPTARSAPQGLGATIGDVWAMTEMVSIGQPAHQSRCGASGAGVQASRFVDADSDRRLSVGDGFEMGWSNCTGETQHTRSGRATATVREIDASSVTLEVALDGVTSASPGLGQEATFDGKLLLRASARDTSVVGAEGLVMSLGDRQVQLALGSIEQAEGTRSAWARWVDG